MKDSGVVSQARMGDEADTRVESHRRALRLLAAMIARRILADRSKLSESQGTQPCVVRPGGIVVKNKRGDAPKYGANHTGKHQRGQAIK